MRIAISTDGDKVSAHFGRCPSFTIADVEEGRVLNKEIISNPGHHTGFLPQFLHNKGVGCIICGGMGQRAIGLFSQHKIQIVVGVSGTIDDVLEGIGNNTFQGGESFCKPGAGKGYGVDKVECEHSDDGTKKGDCHE